MIQQYKIELEQRDEIIKVKIEFKNFNKLKKLG